MQKKGTRGVETTSQVNNTKPKRITQGDIVLLHLREYGSITSMEAFKLYDMTRLSAVVFELREMGYNIPMTMEKSKNGKMYGRYTLKEDEE